MHDPRTFWLIVTNIALGLALVLMILGVLTGIACNFVSNLRKRSASLKELDREMRRLFRDSGRPLGHTRR